MYATLEKMIDLSRCLQVTWSEAKEGLKPQIEFITIIINRTQQQTLETKFVLSIV